MRIGQTSFVVFASKLVGSALGFVATLYFGGRSEPRYWASTPW